MALEKIVEGYIRADLVSSPAGRGRFVPFIRRSLFFRWIRSDSRVTPPRPAVAGILVVLLMCPLPSVLAGNRQKARLAFAEAARYHQSLLQSEPQERGKDHYNRSIYLYRLVIDYDPTYGACDDALYAIATLYEELFDRFGTEDARKDAEYYYRFLAREYPSTRFRQEALQKADSLNSASRGATDDPVEPDSAPATVTEIRYWSTPENTRVVIQLDKETGFSKKVLYGPDRIYFDLEEAQLQSGLEKIYNVNGVSLKRIRVAENRQKVVRVVLDFQKLNRHSVFSLYHPFRIVIDTRALPESERPDRSEILTSAEAVIQLDKGPSSRQVLTERPAVTGPADRLSLTRVLGLKINRIALDPGHGGHDTGTVSPRGVNEKDLVLNISTRLKALLERGLGCEVILTRETDSFVPLERRTAIAANAGADLFISIHANSSKVQRVAGSETFYLSFQSTSEELEVASRENATSQRTVSELEDLLHRIALDDFSGESENLARKVQANLFSSLRHWRPDWKDRGVKKAPFIVLLNSGMPSILVEVGFLSNPQDEKFLASDNGRIRTAEALYEGLKTYLESMATIPDMARTSEQMSR